MTDNSISGKMTIITIHSEGKMVVIIKGIQVEFENPTATAVAAVGFFDVLRRGSAALGLGTTPNVSRSERHQGDALRRERPVAVRQIAPPRLAGVCAGVGAGGD